MLTNIYWKYVNYLYFYSFICCLLFLLSLDKNKLHNITISLDENSAILPTVHGVGVHGNFQLKFNQAVMVLGQTRNYMEISMKTQL